MGFHLGLDVGMDFESLDGERSRRLDGVGFCELVGCSGKGLEDWMELVRGV